MMDYIALKAAYAALGIADPVAAAAALNAQTVQTVVDIPADRATAVLLMAGDWARINALAAMTPSGTAATAPTQQDQAIAAAVECLATLKLYSGKSIQTSDVATWGAIEGMAGALVQAGAMSAASLAAWAAMRTVVGPVWSPPVTVGDLQTAGNC